MSRQGEKKKVARGEPRVLFYGYAVGEPRSVQAHKQDVLRNLGTFVETSIVCTRPRVPFLVFL